MRDFDPDDPNPPFRQLATVMREAIASGEFVPGQKLPSGAELSERYGMASAAVVSAIRELRAEGLITSRHGSGTFVRTAASTRLVAAEHPLAEARVRDVLDRLHILKSRLDMLQALTDELAADHPHRTSTRALVLEAQREQRDLVSTLVPPTPPDAGLRQVTKVPEPAGQEQDPEQPVRRWITGNAEDDGAETRGWLVGHFAPPDSGRHSADVEVKWGIHPAGDTRPEWTAGDHRSTVTMLVSGTFRVDLPDGNVVMARPGDYVMWGAGVDHSWQAIERSTVVTVRWPSASPEV